MKRTTTLLYLMLITGISAALAQETVTVSVGNSYSNMTYYTLADDATTTMANEAWDLAFTTAPGTAGVFFNEAAKFVFTGTPPQLKLWQAQTIEFTDIIDPDDLVDSLYNPENDWETGAFNSMKDTLDPSDFGWGFYDSFNDETIGFRVFALQLRNGSWKKIKIESLIDEVYTMRYADLDGNNETTITIDKADFSGSPFAYFSFDTETTVASPSGWDLLFTRYRERLTTTGTPIQYLVTGALSGPGVQVAEARNVDPATVDYEPYLDSLQTRIDVIGEDWKYFDFTLGWVLDDERAFFAKLANNELWKIVFTAFGGSTTGNFTFEKTFLTTLSGSKEANSDLSSLHAFPNPAKDAFSLVFSLSQKRDNLPLILVNTLGQVVWQTEVQGQAGLNAFEINPGKVTPGLYLLRAGNGGDVKTVRVMLR